MRIAGSRLANVRAQFRRRFVLGLLGSHIRREFFRGSGDFRSRFRNLLRLERAGFERVRSLSASELPRVPPRGRGLRQKFVGFLKTGATSGELGRFLKRVWRRGHFFRDFAICFRYFENDFPLDPFHGRVRVVLGQRFAGENGKVGFGGGLGYAFGYAFGGGCGLGRQGHVLRIRESPAPAAPSPGAAIPAVPVILRRGGPLPPPAPPVQGRGRRRARYAGLAGPVAAPAGAHGPRADPPSCRTPLAPQRNR